MIEINNTSNRLRVIRKGKSVLQPYERALKVTIEDGEMLIYVRRPGDPILEDLPGTLPATKVYRIKNNRLTVVRGKK